MLLTNYALYILITVSIQDGVVEVIDMDWDVRISEGIPSGGSVHHEVLDAGSHELHRERGKFQRCLRSVI